MKRKFKAGQRVILKPLRHVPEERGEILTINGTTALVKVDDKITCVDDRLRDGVPFHQMKLEQGERYGEA